MASERFAIGLTVRLVLLTVCLCGLILSIQHEGFHALTLLLLLLNGLLLFGLYRKITTTNRELSRFLDAVRSKDVSQRFDSQGSGSGFDQLGESLEALMQKTRDDRQQQETRLRRLISLTEQVPAPLLSLHADETVELHNHAARQLLSDRPIHRLDDLGEENATMIDALREITPGERRLVTFHQHGIRRQLAVMATTLISGSQQERLISLQDIHSELEQVQLKAWQDLVRVLTHEIMNSLTPIVSLSHTARDLLAETQNNQTSDADREALNTAVSTVARRSEGLMHFVQRYRSLSALPAPQLKQIELTELLGRVSTLMRDQWQQQSIDLAVNITPERLRLQADPDLLEQMLINLLGNAGQAVADQPSRQVTLSAQSNPQGYILIDVDDNGPGIDNDLVDDVFLPFFTTRADGSGIGLALTRQIMTAHGGTVTLDTSELGGARLRLVFPG